MGVKIKRYYSLLILFSAVFLIIGVIAVSAKEVKNIAIFPKNVSAMMQEVRIERDQQRSVLVGEEDKVLLKSRAFGIKEKLSDDVKNKMLRLRGILPPEDTKTETQLQPKICWNCNESNPATRVFCYKCNSPLNIKQVVEDIKKREQADNMMNELFSDKEFKDMVKVFLMKKQTK